MFSKIKKYRIKRRLKKDDRIQILEGTWLRDDFRWEIRENVNEKPVINIGKDCIIGGSFIIENEKAKIVVGNATTLGAGSMVVAGDADIYIGNHVVMSFGVTFYNTNSHSLDIRERHLDLVNTLEYLRGNSNSRKINWTKIDSKDIVVKDNVWIGFGATILKGVTIGEGAIIGAKSVVTHNVEPYTVVAGNPARVLKILEGHIDAKN